MTTLTRLSTKDAARAAGVTYRQLSYWADCDVIDLGSPGAGRYRQVPPGMVPILRLLGTISRATLTGVNVALLRDVVDNYHRGQLDLGAGVFLTWQVES